MRAREQGWCRATIPQKNGAPRSAPVSSTQLP
jgi:hypothetical protein